MPWIRKGFKVKLVSGMGMMFKLEINASQQGLKMFLKDWQERARFCERR